MAQDLQEIYAETRRLFDPYLELYLVERDGPEGISLTSHEGGEISFEGTIRSYPTMFFASAVIRKSSVVFYFMPVYIWPELQAQFGDELLKTLKGRTCFHLKRMDENLRSQISTALAIGHRKYSEKGWAKLSPPSAQGV